MLEVKTQINDLELVYNSTMHIRTDDLVKLDFATGKLNIVIQKDLKQRERKIDFNVEGDLLEISFINYQSGTGHGVLQPWKIGNMSGKEFFMTFYIQYVAYDGRDIYFCSLNLYSGKEVKND